MPACSFARASSNERRRAWHLSHAFESKHAHCSIKPALKLLKLQAQDPPEYYDRPGGFLAFTPDVPQELLDAAPPPQGQPHLVLNGTLGHFDLVHHQLRQVPVIHGALRFCLCRWEPQAGADLHRFTRRIHSGARARSTSGHQARPWIPSLHDHATLSHRCCTAIHAA